MYSMAVARTITAARPHDGARFNTQRTGARQSASRHTGQDHRGRQSRLHLAVPLRMIRVLAKSELEMIIDQSDEDTYGTTSVHCAGQTARIQPANSETRLG